MIGMMQEISDNQSLIESRLIAQKPLDISGIGKGIDVSLENCDWNIELGQIVGWWVFLAIPSPILTLTMIISLELLNYNHLNIIKSIAVSCSSWNVCLRLS
jgi:hypothetical protein